MFRKLVPLMSLIKCQQVEDQDPAVTFFEILLLLFLCVCFLWLQSHQGISCSNKVVFWAPGCRHKIMETTNVMHLWVCCEGAILQLDDGVRVPLRSSNYIGIFFISHEQI